LELPHFGGVGKAVGTVMLVEAKLALGNPQSTYFRVENQRWSCLFRATCRGQSLEEGGRGEGSNLMMLVN
jgi:hypothetical protein